MDDEIIYQFLFHCCCVFQKQTVGITGKNISEHGIFFDDRFFMYFEDFDLIRRLHKVDKTVFLPDAEIVHDHAAESYRSRKMLAAHIKSAIRYFNKWGWFFDGEQHAMNKKILEEIREMNDVSKSI